ncbi:MAG: hypothetical protein FWG30_07070 [Eubacteriaceae bacterium]|nr:hypothetical protein [Eubacteriaceae bacterium]
MENTQSKSMRYTIERGGLRFESPLFDIDKTFGCGQAFRFQKQQDGSTSGIAFGKELTLVNEGRYVFLPGVSELDFLNVWAEFLSLDEDYSMMNAQIAGEESLDKAIEFGAGIRILKQDPWEATISFIISQNNNIPRISKTIEKLCYSYSEAGIFPSSEDIVQGGKGKLEEMGLGYRDSYVFSAAQMHYDGMLDFEAISHMATNDARSRLMQLKGIGPKVADCILLFSLGKTDACPHDVWMKRALSSLYGLSGKDAAIYVEQNWGKYAGLAQQYLFYAYREGLFS